jgi:hypothetical protein
VGVDKVGMLAFSHTDGWNAVGGRHTGNGRGVAGDSDSGPGVYGKSTTGPGLYGETISGAQGVYGRAELTARASPEKVSTAQACWATAG